MKERPILFRGEMVKAILEGRKTQTRRVAKFVPIHKGLNLDFSELKAGHYFTDVPSHGWVLRSRRGDGCWEDKTYRKLCPYGLPGDLLWVKETWRPCTCERCNAQYSHGQLPIHEVEYRADGDDPHGWKSSRFMPRWASRITLKIKNIRVERVQDISLEDITAEGCTTEMNIPWMSDDDSPVGIFGGYWDFINAKRGFSWEVNPWVWVIEFEVKQ